MACEPTGQQAGGQNHRSRFAALLFPERPRQWAQAARVFLRRRAEDRSRNPGILILLNRAFEG
jgi:hypothetical protein